MINFIAHNISESLSFFFFFALSEIRILVSTDEVIIESNQIFLSIVSLVAGWSAQCKILLTTFLTLVHLDVIRRWKVYFLFMLLIIVIHKILFPFNVCYSFLLASNLPNLFQQMSWILL